MAVADDPAASVAVGEVGEVVDPAGDLGLDGLGRQAACPAPQQAGQQVPLGGQGHDADAGGRLAHGGGLLGLVGPRCARSRLHHQGYPAALQPPAHDCRLYPGHCTGLAQNNLSH